MINFDPQINFEKYSKIKGWNNEPSVLSARPKIQQLPFLNNLKNARNLLVNLKNQKLRNSHYFVTQGNQVPQNAASDIFRHQKGKLSVNDLVSQEAKFQQLSNTIQHSLNNQIKFQSMQTKQSQKQELKQQQKLLNSINLSGKNSSQQQPRKQTFSILSKKNRLAEQLNKLGHQLQQTYYQVQQLQKIFSILCNYYSKNRKIVQKNLKMKEQKGLINQKIKQYLGKIEKNQREENFLDKKKQEFIKFYKQTLTSYIRQIILYNRQEEKIMNLFMKQSQKNFTKSNFHQKSKSLNAEQFNFKEQDQQQDLKPIEINLKFSLLKNQLQRIKIQKKNAQQNKNKEKNFKFKNESNQSNSFSKLYGSQIFTL